jgi:hypothetical protein
LESFMTAMISGISLPKASDAQRRAFPAILSPKHLAAAARLAAEIKIHHMPELASWTVEACELGWTAAGTSDWGTDCRDAGELLADALNRRAPQIFDTIKNGDSERRVLNRDIAPYHDREMTVLCRDERMAWLNMIRPECNLLHTLPPGSFRVSRASAAVVRSLRSRFDSVTAPHRPDRRSPRP